jgi:hypothetical protein
VWLLLLQVQRHVEPLLLFWCQGWRRRAKAWWRALCTPASVSLASAGCGAARRCQLARECQLLLQLWRQACWTLLLLLLLLLWLEARRRRSATEHTLLLLLLRRRMASILAQQAEQLCTCLLTERITAWLLHAGT